MQDRSAQQLGNYRLLHLLGSGGFADVYLAEHVYLKTQVAVKVLHTRLLERDAQKFLNEARTVAHLQHPHIVRVLEYGVQDTHAFLVMDYAPHGTLRERYPEGMPQPLATVLPVVKQMSSALQYAHDQQLIHRDVKPENMLVGRDQVIWLSDFGLAIVARSTLTQSRQEAFGTIAYMAPEQIRGRPRPASDQYALAAVVYEWLCGSPPFDGDSAITLAFQHISEPPPSPRSRVGTISSAIEAILLRALAKDPHARFASIQEFAQALEDASLNRFIMPSAPLPVASTDAPIERRFDPAPIPEHRISRRAWLAAGVGGLGLLAALGTGAAFIMQRKVVPSTSIIRIPVPPPRSFATPTETPAPTSSLPTATPLPGSLLTYRGHSEAVYNVAWSPDGKLIASCDPHALQVWDALTGNRVMSTNVRTSNEAITGVAWSPDSKAVAFSTGVGNVYVLGVPAGNMIMLHSHNNPAGFYGDARSLSLAWSPDGQHLVSAGL
ncbi:MAG TPA: serine/threonine-protein kinase, partial [Ktedonobacteraceae bacterium]|nr:serine/threonine-protein kinase [Ktedonobacteraceae bacterium]